MSEDFRYTQLEQLIYDGEHENAAECIRRIAQQSGTQNIRALLNEIDAQDSENIKWLKLASDANDTFPPFGGV